MRHYPAYLFAYFTGESAPDAEQVHFAVSAEDAHMTFLPVTTSGPTTHPTLGTGGVRDPFLIRNEINGGFHLIGTDLSIYRDSDWDRAVRQGSRSLIVWDSADLLAWDEPRLVEVAPSNAGCAWAPEAFLDPDSGTYIVLWSSTLYDEDDAERAKPAHLRVLRSHTSDFRTFSEPEIYLDPGHSVIDTTFLTRAGRTYRFTKDERPRSASATGKHVFQEVGHGGILGSFQPVAAGVGAPHLGQGEGPIAVNSPDGHTCYLLIDEFGGRGYMAFSSVNPGTGVWTPVPDTVLPAGARHGSLLPITTTERTALLAFP